MKNYLLALATLATFSPLAALAHGSTAAQALAALSKATQIFESTQSTDVRRQFLAIAATQTGHEQFAVVLTLKNNTQLRFACQENEEVSPVVWECAAQ